MAIDTPNITPVVLCGGSGTRMWPLSRGGYAKQFLSLVGNESLLQQTVLRLASLENVEPLILIANQDQRFMVAEQLRSVGVERGRIVLEPVARNTAPAVAAAALLAQRSDERAIMLVLPSDHVVQNADAFARLVQTGRRVAAMGRLVTFGIVPDRPHTGYGYIRRGESLNVDGIAYAVDRFVEKPDRERAERFLQEGNYSWNSGMFMFRADVYLAELERHHPQMLAQVRAAVESGQLDLDFLRLDAQAFDACPSDSIDFAVMEKSDKTALVEANELGWSDIGSWEALSEVTPSDAARNNVIGDVLVHDVSNCYLRSEHRVVAAVGVSDLVVVETADAVLIAHKDSSQDVKKIVEQLNGAGRRESVSHRKVYRPWGSYEGIDEGDRFQVKRIIVKPGASLSLQMHFHRAEHWIVVKGTARVVNGDKEILLAENQSTYIPLGAMHRLENPGKLPLELIEVQSGAYLGEDDIVRVQDNYGRVATTSEK
ncbi:mannose-1-phosphate guanylyltransferase/mannose-6-phosphate isomerase [Paraburkholderia sp. J67]|uniref:mannose-1-phosphate guanylyltransferase/mannose-6-phosphate isomerase n=1 Tax=Paraburkholderia sp. J67 TaxID=2805435 RepID=UPI002ABE9D6E|nr:mannose-1-phosphate guanylyltransferase/mannose-6-phosphate isomerase [Paraburkholderia sp. J67]